ncbi:ABC transporter ATP-binding protein [Candidatus Stoquefichus massiliensis]|uniref:ABC transporter ATP-binding protein n=1 Tax=Candidatus Stoquefichus massiliensis TaxID=1470350 RepID=UPI000480D33D|nr:ABC transporter ATP-binding protein [Candidatus Stoquefichus massiliensis]
MEAIRIENICKLFSQKQVLNDICIEIEKGEIFGLLGPSGAGKTTLIHIITGQLAPDSGKSYILGKNSLKLSHDDYTHIGLVLDQEGLYTRLSCYDNLALFASIYQLDKAKIEKVLKQVHLYDDRKKTVSELSKGMRQRLVLARAIMHEPQILFLDEPTSGLDPATTLKIHNLLLELKDKGTAIFLTTHNMEEAAKLCHRVALLHEGKIIECDSPVTICERHNDLNKVIITTKDHQKYILNNNRESAQHIYQLFQSENIQSIHSSEPTLGNVFISLTGKELG